LIGGAVVKDYSVERKKWRRTSADPEGYSRGRFTMVKHGFMWNLYYVATSPRIVDNIEDRELKPPFIWASEAVETFQNRRGVANWDERKIRGRPGSEKDRDVGIPKAK
jgi:hypothetical protein